MTFLIEEKIIFILLFLIFFSSYLFKSYNIKILFEIYLFKIRHGHYCVKDNDCLFGLECDLYNLKCKCSDPCMSYDYDKDACDCTTREDKERPKGAPVSFIIILFLLLLLIVSTLIESSS